MTKHTSTSQLRKLIIFLFFFFQVTLIQAAPQDSTAVDNPKVTPLIVKKSYVLANGAAPAPTLCANWSGSYCDVQLTSKVCESGYTPSLLTSVYETYSDASAVMRGFTLRGQLEGRPLANPVAYWYKIQSAWSKPNKTGDWSILYNWVIYCYPGP